MILVGPVFVILISLNFVFAEPRTCAICVENTNCDMVNGEPWCVCNAGYTGNPYSKCTNITDGCKGRCSLNAECRIDPISNGRRPHCVCKEGLSGDPFRICYNSTEVNTHGCGPVSCEPNAYCSIHFGGGPQCVCKVGYERKKGQCTRIDPCLNGRSPCIQNAECRTTNGTATCVCRAGFRGDPYTRCFNGTDPCDGYRCVPNSYCQASLYNRAAKCVCRDGFFLHKLLHECIEGVDPCLAEPCRRGKCRHDPTNRKGYICKVCGGGFCTFYHHTAWSLTIGTKE